LPKPASRCQSPPLLRVMTLAIDTDDHGDELVVHKDKTALTVVAVDEHALALECDVEGHCRHPHVGAKGQLPNGRTPAEEAVRNAGWPGSSLN
jgi:hypothetical protein